MSMTSRTLQVSGLTLYLRLRYRMALGKVPTPRAQQGASWKWKAQQLLQRVHRPVAEASPRYPNDQSLKDAFCVPHAKQDVCAIPLPSLRLATSRRRQGYVVLDAGFGSQASHLLRCQSAQAAVEYCGGVQELKCQMEDKTLRRKSKRRSGVARGREDSPIQRTCSCSDPCVVHVRTLPVIFAATTCNLGSDVVRVGKAECGAIATVARSSCLHSPLYLCCY